MIPVVAGVVAAITVITVAGMTVKSQNDRKAAAEKVMEPFRKLESAVIVGVTSGEHGRLVQEARFALCSHKPSDDKGKAAATDLAYAPSSIRRL